jgi:hypothetical protein
VANLKKARTRRVTQTEGRAVDVTVKENDSVDIRCGGPRTLGFDFFVHADEDADDLENFLRAELRKNRLPCMSIFISEPRFSDAKLWTRAKMAACIKKDADGMRW